jgi:3'-phosphoadenosine 5'-phosphosulfate sulfotransferase (PAPS reductase)/FAD synthetase
MLERDATGAVQPPAPRLDQFNLFHVGMSGGKDSTALALWSWYESGIPRDQIRVVFCDTGNEDALTYAFLDYLRELFPIETLNPEYDFYELANKKKRFPSRKAQFCTQFLKIIPNREHIMRLMREGHEVCKLNGVRREEGHSSNTRSTAEAWEFDAGPYCWTHRPLLHWTIDDIWEMHRRYLSLDRVCDLIADDPTMQPERKQQLIERMRQKGVPRNPLYEMGASRVGCFPCINSRKAELRSLAKFRPERVDYLEQKEQEIRNRHGRSTFFARTHVPEHLRSLEVSTASGETVKVPTIRDVIEWAQTARGGWQFDMDFDDDDLPVSACDVGGFCE